MNYFHITEKVFIPFIPQQLIQENRKRPQDKLVLTLLEY